MSVLTVIPAETALAQQATNSLKVLSHNSKIQYLIISIFVLIC